MGDAKGKSQIRVFLITDFIETAIVLTTGGRAAQLQVCKIAATGEDVVIKTMRLSDAYTAKEFMHEAEVIASCQHPNTVILYGVCYQSSALAAFVLGWAPGGNLRSALPTLTPPQRYSILRDIVIGLQFLHSKCVAHQNLKPENVILDAERCHARLTDIGNASMKTDQASSRVRFGDYTALEARAGKGSLPSDVWSLGVMIYEIALSQVLMPSAAGQFSSTGFVNVIAIGNPALRQLLQEIFQSPADRPDINKIVQRLEPTMFELDASRSVVSLRPEVKPVELPEAFRARMERASDPDEQNWVGDQFYFGLSGVPKDEAMAMSWFYKAANGGNKEAMWNLGHCFAKGIGVVPDASKSASWYQRSAELGHVESFNSVGICYRDGAGVPKDPARAVWWFQKAAGAGSQTGMMNLSRCFSSGFGVPKDLSLAAFWHGKAAEAGSAYGMDELGTDYEFGRGVAKDPRAAVFWYQKAALGGDTDGMVSIARVAIDARDYANGIMWLSKAAEQGNDVAWWRLGECYETGTGIAKNSQLACGCYQKSADSGNTYGQAHVARCYQNGVGTPQNYQAAAFWFLKAAEGGHAEAMANLGICYEKGMGVAKDFSAAGAWYLKAGQAGYPQAQNLLTMLYQRDRATRKSECCMIA